MDDNSLRDFFLNPSGPTQRQYEALRCVFVDGLSQKAAAERFGYSHDSFRQLVHQFRSRLAAGDPPPFFTNHPKAGQRGRLHHRRAPSYPPSPTPAA